MLLGRIERVVRLVRSKGVGVYFVTQNPLNIPDSMPAQLGNLVQHALRAFTPRDRKAVKAMAQTMRQKPGLDIEAAITELAVDEALVSFPDAKDRPTMTRTCLRAATGQPDWPHHAAAAQSSSGGILGGLGDVLLDATGPRGGQHDVAWPNPWPNQPYAP